MRLILLFSILCLSACSGPVLKRCPNPVADPQIMSCPEQVQGAFWKCEKAKDLRSCQDAL